MMTPGRRNPSRKSSPRTYCACFGGPDYVLSLLSACRRRNHQAHPRRSRRNPPGPDYHGAMAMMTVASKSGSRIPPGEPRAHGSRPRSTRVQRLLHPLKAEGPDRALPCLSSATGARRVCSVCCRSRPVGEHTRSAVLQAPRAPQNPRQVPRYCGHRASCTPSPPAPTRLLRQIERPPRAECASKTRQCANAYESQESEEGR